MRTIDPKTGKRLVETDPETIKSMKKNDPVRKMGDKDFEHIENSPMDPPEAYRLASPDFDLSEHAILQLFRAEHQIALQEIQLFELAIRNFKELGYHFDKEINQAFGKFFEFFDNKILLHNLKEEKSIFPALHKKLIETGEHSHSNPPRTGIDLLEDDHVKFIQLGALVFNLLGLGTRIPDPSSRMIVFEQAFSSGWELIELLRLHIFREDNHIFPQAAKLLSSKELDFHFSELGKLPI
ncbi:Hemerythrin HHE cation binding domain-containing protein [Algoriphagus alkaliphilus]|uniref:Hemerythrin HHE cation binding domain-containing protein n=1 Tax=Algoriphagus alkaliphilus TaxID=279824 RepID=A0A1G5VRJ0_9BACT|nr:hemerythrin domain-containing protein [Algoriphagus alkaliphilus]MBA4298540.1 hemerythrin domain-containing protein [Cyclobacterium sp.]SDA48469.1 Hemerythrin HHE cation binding domain-containing protein [Algoriphagus alkaliphilus]